MAVPSRRLRMLLALACLAALASPAAAEEGAPSPAEAYAALTAALPAPTAAEGFRFTGVLRLNGKNMGHATLAAHPIKGETPLWEARDHFVMKGRAVPRTEVSTVRMTQALKILEGTSRTSNPDDHGLTWVRSEGGFTAEQATQVEKRLQKRTSFFLHEGTALTTLSATVLFCRLALPKKADYATTVFEVEAGMKRTEDATRPLTFKVLGEQELQGQKVWAVSARKGSKELTILFKPTTREVVAVRIVEGETRLEILPGDMWVMPATDAVTAGMRGMYALAAGDLAILDDVMHWPSLHKQELAKATPEKRAKSTDVEVWRTNVLAGYAKHLQKRPAQMMQQIIKSGKAQIKQEKLEGGRVKLTFGPMMRTMQFVVAPFDGVWQVVEQPGQPKKQGQPKNQGQPTKPAPGSGAPGK